MSEDKPRKKYEITPAERLRRSEAAKALHAEGKIGGAQKGAGRPRKQRAQEVVAEGIRDDGDKILKALREALKDKSNTTKLKAALAMLEIESKETELKIKEEQRTYDNMSKDKLLELAFERIQQLKEQGIDVGEVIQGRARESGSGTTQTTSVDPGHTLSTG